MERPHRPWNRYLSTLIENGPAYGMDIRQDPRRQMDWLRGIDPHCLLSMPSNLEFVAGLLAQNDQRLPELQVIQSMGEPLSREARHRIESVFGVPVKDTYSNTEVGYLASPCPSGAGLHAHAENAIVEVPTAPTISRAFRGTRAGWCSRVCTTFSRPSSATTFSTT